MRNKKIKVLLAAFCVLITSIIPARAAAEININAVIEEESEETVLTTEKAETEAAADAEQSADNTLAKESREVWMPDPYLRQYVAMFIGVPEASLTKEMLAGRTIYLGYSLYSSSPYDIGIGDISSYQGLEYADDNSITISGELILEDMEKLSVYKDKIRSIDPHSNFKGLEGRYDIFDQFSDETTLFIDFHSGVNRNTKLYLTQKNYQYFEMTLTEFYDGFGTFGSRLKGFDETELNDAQFEIYNTSSSLLYDVDVRDGKICFTLRHDVDFTQLVGETSVPTDNYSEQNSMFVYLNGNYYGESSPNYDPDSSIGQSYVSLNIEFAYESDLQVEYVDEDGSPIKDTAVIPGIVSQNYAVKIPEISGYTYKEASGALDGVYTLADTAVTLTYSKNQEPAGNKPQAGNSNTENTGTAKPQKTQTQAKVSGTAAVKTGDTSGVWLYLALGGVSVITAVLMYLKRK